MQEKNITPFDFEDNMIRVHMDEQGNPWFVASDVAKALGYEKPNNAIQMHCKKVNKITQDPKIGQPPRSFNIIPESDLYRLIMRSNLPSAERFQDWVVEDVLPTLRKTGTYTVQPPVQKPMPRSMVNRDAISYVKPSMRANLLGTAQRVCNMAGYASPQDVEDLFARYCELVMEGSYEGPHAEQTARKEQYDKISLFAAEHLMEKKGNRVQSADLYTLFRDWWKEEYEESVPSHKSFGKVMKDFYPRERRGGLFYYNNVDIM